MTAAPVSPPTGTIRALFAAKRPIDRPIEKVIDYYAADERRLRSEVEEYEVTDNVERNLRRFLDVFDAGVRAGQATETGIWVSGFYGSGKSSFTKYLGFALDPACRVGDQRFLELLAERIETSDVRQHLKTLAEREPVAVIMLDLGAEQLASSATTTVSTVLYWKVLQWAGYSKEEKLAQLEFRLDRDGQLDAFKQAYASQFGKPWDEVHSDPLIGISHADQLVPQFYPQEFPERGAFRSLRFSLASNVRDLAADILDLVQRKSGRRNVLFLIDEVGQYVAPSGALILNLDGLARNLKELGQGRAWIMATGQQTLTEIIERAAYNSEELNKLRDRFPIALELDARDIREITWRRLLSKSAPGEAQLTALYRQHGQALIHNTRLTGTALFRGEVDEQSFVRLYPFLPQHFDLLLELVRALAHSAIGLRSAIRVIQDLLVDASKVLPAGTTLLADQPVGRLATADQFYDTLRADLARVLPHVVVGVDRVATALPDDELALRAAKAVAALQPIEGFPRTAENLAALLYAHVGGAPHGDAVRAALGRLTAAKEIGLVEDPQAGGYAFLSEGVKPLRDKRNSYMPTTAEINLLRSQLLKTLFDSLPSVNLEGAKTVRAGVSYGRVPIAGEGEEVQFRLETADAETWDARREALLTDTTGQTEWRKAIAWLIRPAEVVEDALVEAVRSRNLIRDTRESEADRDVAQYVRSERHAAEASEERIVSLYRQALQEGTLIFRGNPTPAGVAGRSIEEAARKVLADAAAKIYPSFHLVPIRPAMDLAAKFLGVERLDRMPREADPLGLVVQTAGRYRVDAAHPALAEALRAFRERLDQSGTARLQGNALQDQFAAAPYGWSKDATRYVFAALLVAGEIALHTANGEIRTAGPGAVEVFRSTLAFGRVGVALRDSRPSLEMLDRAATRLENLLGVEVMPLEDSISRAVRERLPTRLDTVAALAPQLRLLNLAGANRAQDLADVGRELLRGDGAGAVAVLGAASCTFPEDLEWAKRAIEALENGAADDIRAAQTIVAEADEVARLFPRAQLVEQTERETLADALASDAFYLRLADLRGLDRILRERAAEHYRAQLAGYEAGLAELRQGLEAMPEWLRLTDDDRSEVAGRLAHELPPAPPGGQELAYLRLVLVRLGELAGRRAELEAEVRRLIPPLVIQDGDGVTPIDLALAEVAQPAVLHSTEEIDDWLADLRAKLTNRLVAGAPLQIRVR